MRTISAERLRRRWLLCCFRRYSSAAWCNVTMWVSAVNGHRPGHAVAVCVSVLSRHSCSQCGVILHKNEQDVGTDEAQAWTKIAAQCAKKLRFWIKVSRASSAKIWTSWVWRRHRCLFLVTSPFSTWKRKRLSTAADTFGYACWHILIAIHYLAAQTCHQPISPRTFTHFTLHLLPGSRVSDSSPLAYLRERTSELDTGAFLHCKGSKYLLRGFGLWYCKKTGE